MKRFKSKEKLERAEELIELIAQRLEIEKKEKALKDYFKVELKGGGTAMAGDVLISVESAQRKNLSKDLLIAKLGDLTEYETVTYFEKLYIKKVV